jgi:hypothetical protein
VKGDDHKRICDDRGLNFENSGRLVIAQGVGEVVERKESFVEGSGLKEVGQDRVEISRMGKWDKRERGILGIMGTGEMWVMVGTGSNGRPSFRRDRKIASVNSQKVSGCDVSVPRGPCEIGASISGRVRGDQPPNS